MELGRRLRDARERKGLTLADIAQRTNISLPVLDAIERGDVARVPGGFFIRAHLRAFAGQVGLDAEQVLSAYHAEHEPRPVEDELFELRRRCSARAAREARWTPAILLAIGAMILVIFGL
jgi:cytoskeleton protein RodZ